MAQHQGRWPVSVRGEGLQVSRSGVDADVQGHPPACIEAEEAALWARGQAIAAETEHSSGSRRMAKPLPDEGLAGGRYQARRLRRQAKVTVQRPKTRGPVTTDSRYSEAVAPNWSARQFDVEPPDQVWVGDIP
jgi:putative transposase